MKKLSFIDFKIEFEFYYCLPVAEKYLEKFLHMQFFRISAS